MADVYLSPGGKRVDKATWKKYNNERYVIRKYENERVSLRLRCMSVIPNGSVIPPEQWKRFGVVIENIVTNDSDGRPYSEPKRVYDPDSAGYRTHEEASAAYERFLAKYTQSYFDAETGNLVEEGNIYTPPDPDVPVVAESSPMSSVAGSW